MGSSLRILACLLLAATAIPMTGLRDAASQDDISSLRVQRDGEERIGNWVVWPTRFSAVISGGTTAETWPSSRYGPGREGTLQVECRAGFSRMRLSVAGLSGEAQAVLSADGVLLQNFRLNASSDWQIIAESAVAGTILDALRGKRTISVAYLNDRGYGRYDYVIAGVDEVLKRLRERCRW